MLAGQMLICFVVHIGICEMFLSTFSPKLKSSYLIQVFFSREGNWEKGFYQYRAIMTEYHPWEVRDTYFVFICVFLNVGLCLPHLSPSHHNFLLFWTYSLIWLFLAHAHFMLFKLTFLFEYTQILDVWLVWTIDST